MGSMVDLRSLEARQARQAWPGTAGHGLARRGKAWQARF